MAQYKNVLNWLETQYLNPAMEITRRVVNEADPLAEDPNNYPELKELEAILEEALEYVKRHQG